MANQRSVRPGAMDRPHRNSWAQASRHATALIAQRKRGPRRCLPIDGPRPTPGAIPKSAARHPEPALSNQPDYYAILNIAPTATARDIARAYRSLLRTHHPDTRQKNDDGDPAGAGDVQELHAIMQAYVVLSDPAKRAAYDRSRRTAAQSTPAGQPVNVRIHRAAPAPTSRAQPPLVAGPVHWAPLSRSDPSSPRSHT